MKFMITHVKASIYITPVRARDFPKKSSWKCIGIFDHYPNIPIVLKWALEMLSTPFCVLVANRIHLILSEYFSIILFILLFHYLMVKMWEIQTFCLKTTTNSQWNQVSNAHPSKFKQNSLLLHMVIWCFNVNVHFSICVLLLCW